MTKRDKWKGVFMRATMEAARTRPETKVTVTTDGLREILSCGYQSAVVIGEQAHAKILVGRRVLWNVAKIQRYLDEISV